MYKTNKPSSITNYILLRPLENVQWQTVILCNVFTPTRNAVDSSVHGSQGRI